MFRSSKNKGNEIESEMGFLIAAQGVLDIENGYRGHVRLWNF